MNLLKKRINDCIIILVFCYGLLIDFSYLISTYYKIRHKKASISNYGNTRFLIFRSVFALLLLFRLTHGYKFFGCSWVNRHSCIKVCLGCSHFDSNSKSLNHFINTVTNSMKSDNFSSEPAVINLKRVS